jgi:type II secretory pathway pseudopilin PulG
MNMIENTQNSNKSQLRFSLKSFGLIVLVLLLVGALAGFTWSYFQYRRMSAEVQHLSSIEGQQEVAKQETQELLSKIKQFIILPDDEEPIVATITDPEKLAAEQNFYQGAIKGDKVLVFVKAQKAVIYSPERNILVNVGPAFMQPQTGADESEQVSSTPTPEASPAEETE